MKEFYKHGAMRMAEKTIEAASTCKELNGAMLVFLHRSVDGDCIGSATGVCTILRRLGVEAYIAMPEDLPSNMSFFGIDDLLFKPEDNFVNDMTINGRKVVRAFSVDCTEGHRMGSCGDIYDSFTDSLTIDHHEVTNLETEYKWIVPEASSASELVFYFAKEVAAKLGISLNEVVDTRAAQCMLAGIVTDTGRFTYNNTKPESLVAAGELMELGGKINTVCYNLFDRKSKQEFLISNTACIESEFFADGKIVLSVVTEEMFKKFNAGKDDIADVVSRLRDIDGVELAIVLREAGNGQVRGNLRSKKDFDCTKLAGNFGGGGHKNASGFTVNDADILSIKDEVIKVATEILV